MVLLKEWVKIILPSEVGRKRQRCDVECYSAGNKLSGKVPHLLLEYVWGVCKSAHKEIKHILYLGFILLDSLIVGR